MIEAATSQMELLPTSVRFDWALFGRWIQPPDNSVLQSNEVVEGFGTVVRALLLIKGATVGFSFVRFRDETNPAVSFGLSGLPFPPREAWFQNHDRISSLEESELPTLAKTSRLIHRALQGPDSATVSLALGRLDDVYRRYSDVDRLIDSEVALEAVLLRGVGSELSFRQALRGSILLGGEAERRKSNFDLLRAAYRRRNKVVHGAKDPGDPPSELVLGVTREVLCKFLEMLENASHESVMEQLDRQALEA